MLTKAQLKYIMAIRELAGGRVSQKNICEYLNVKKPTASIALKSLEELGYIEKNGVNYGLKQSAYEIVEQMNKEKFEFLSLFNDFLGIEEELCNKAYENVFGGFSKELIEKLELLREKGYNKNALNGDRDFNDKQEERPFADMARGRYELPFQVVQCDNSARSMGDKGFYHPAELVLTEDSEYVILRAKEIYYKAQNEQVLKGSLQRLEYLDTDMKWVEAEAVDNKWILPFKKIMYQRDNYDKVSIGIIKIKASSTTIKMPESVADITFNFKLAKFIKA